MKKEKLLLIGIVVAVLLALVAVGTVLGQEPEKTGDEPPQPNPTPEVPVDEREEKAEVLPAALVGAQFTYQGRLTSSGGSPLSGQYDFQVQLWNGPNPSTATQVGATISVNGVAVSDGLFNLTLPVTTSSFNGRALYLRMRVRPTGGPTWDTWTNTQPILAVPLAFSVRPGATIGGMDAGNGNLYLRDSAHRQTIWLDGGAAWPVIGTSGNDGDLTINAGNGATAFWFDGDTAQLRLGTSSGNAGDLIIRDNAGNNTIWLDGNSQTILGGLHSTNGILTLKSNYDVKVYLDSEYVGDHITWFRVFRNTSATTTQELFRVEQSGLCRARGAFSGSSLDYADMLPVAGSASELEPGDVLVISKKKDFAVELSPKSFDTSVIGIYSTQPAFLGGAGLGTQVVNGVPVAMGGVVPCKVSAENGPIQRGDLLTTSSTPGYAMRAGENPPPGTVLGKAMGELAEGTGTIEVLVTLQ